MDPTDAFPKDISTTMVPVKLPEKPDALGYAARQGQKGFHLGEFRKMKKFKQMPYKLPPPTSAYVPAEKGPLEEEPMPFSMRRSKMHITPVIKLVSKRSQTELPIAEPLVPEPIQIPKPMQIPNATCPRTTCADSRASCPRT
ncbi:hypothetical protein TNCV_156331 [Trichonephila clavipes]|nr:hypothetical protein TNCV_156331 [Trichonephila clavipes]